MSENQLIIEQAPMQGVTDWSWRQVQRSLFSPADKYYSPFISPTSEHVMTARWMREICPEHNEGINLIPQVIGHSAEDFLWISGELLEMGYKEINLNLGCPYPMETKKKKGAGLLEHTELLESLLTEIFMNAPLDISIKTRIGVNSEDEFCDILNLFNRFPIKELVIHARLSKQMYTGTPFYTAWDYASEKSTAKALCYNGDIFSAESAESFLTEHKADRIMLGRGLASNPALIEEIRHEGCLDKARLELMHFKILEQMQKDGLPSKHILMHMKELMRYWGTCFDDCAKPLKRVFKSQTLPEYLSNCAAFFRECELIQK